MDDHRVKLIRPCHWEEVFLEWYKTEGTDPKWAQLAKEKGYASWADWRIKGFARRGDFQNAEWAFYEISEPAEVLADWQGGPFRSWIERFYGGAQTRTFAELAARPGIAEHEGIRSLMADYPAASMIVALELRDGRIYVVEGMHRSCALALMRKEGRPAPDKLVFAVGRSVLAELPPVGQNSVG